MAGDINGEATGFSNNKFSFASFPMLYPYEPVLLSVVSGLQGWGANSVLVHVANHLHFGHGDEPFIYHFIQSWEQFLKVLFGVDHGHHNRSIGGPQQMRLVNTRACSELWMKW
jgi:hypothetical protein